MTRDYSRPCPHRRTAFYRQAVVLRYGSTVCVAERCRDCGANPRPSAFVAKRDHPPDVDSLPWLNGEACAGCERLRGIVEGLEARLARAEEGESTP